MATFTAEISFIGDPSDEDLLDDMRSLNVTSEVSGNEIVFTGSVESLESLIDKQWCIKDERPELYDMMISTIKA